MLQKSKELFKAWNNNCLVYNHWKSNEHLVEGLDGDTDLDVQLLPAHKEKGCVILREIGFVHFASQFGSRYPNVEDWIGFDDETGKLLHLHLHYALVTGHTGMKEYMLPWTEEALRTRIQDETTGVYIMNPNLELVSLYTRLILKAKRKWVYAAKKGRYKIDNHFFVEIDYIKKQVDWVAVSDIAKRYYGEHGEMFVEITKSESLSSKQFLQLYAIVTKSMKQYSRYHGISQTIRRFFYPIVLPVRVGLRKRYAWNIITRKVANPSNGFSIAFIGQDGCGKSTVSSDIEKWLNWKIDAKRFYLGSGEHYKGIFQRLFALGTIRRNKIKSSGAVVSDSLSVKHKKNLKNRIYACLIALNFLSISKRVYKELLRSEKYRHRGGIPLFDRFPQVQFDGIYDGPKIDDFCRRSDFDFTILKLMAKKEKSILEKAWKLQPALVFKLLLSPEESIKRKPFENLDMVKRKHDITKQLVFKDSNVILVDATQDYQLELIQIKKEIWKAIQKSQE